MTHGDLLAKLVEEACAAEPFIGAEKVAMCLSGVAWAYAVDRFGPEVAKALIESGAGAFPRHN